MIPKVIMELNVDPILHFLFEHGMFFVFFDKYIFVILIHEIIFIY